MLRTILSALAASELEGHTSNPCVSRGYEPSSGALAAKVVTSNLAGNLSFCEAEASALLKARKGIIFSFSKPSMFFIMLDSITAVGFLFSPTVPVYHEVNEYSVNSLKIIPFFVVRNGGSHPELNSFCSSMQINAHKPPAKYSCHPF